MEIEWKGEKGSVNEVGYNKADPEHALVKIDPQYFRPTEVELLLGDPAKAKKVIGYVLLSSLPPSLPPSFLPSSS
jgi:GDPmannose 4,6-dehydratase